MRPVPLLLLALLPTACASLPATQNTPYLPAGVYGIYQDNDIGAINQSAWAFASPANTRGNPVAAAKAIVALEYLPGELAENPRWVGIDASIPYRLGLARQDVQQVIGIRPDAPRQAVVNALLDLSSGLETRNPAQVTQALASPVFTRPPAATMQALSNLPYIQTANLATSRAEDESVSAEGQRD